MKTVVLRSNTYSGTNNIDLNLQPKQMKQRYAKILGLLFVTIMLTSCFQNQEADLVIHNATIYSMDEANTVYAAVAVKDGKIIDLGPEREILNRYSAKKKIDAQKRFVYPGLYDAHSHFSGYAINKGELNLFGVTSKEDLVNRTVTFAKKSKRLWIVGRGWDNTTWEDKSYPNKAELDSIFPDRPVLLTRVDGHAALVNQTALDIAGIDADFEIHGGAMMKDVDGNLTGILLDKAEEHINSFIPPLALDLKIKLMQEAEQDCFAAGLTTVTDAGLSVEDIMLLDSLQKVGILSINIVAMLQPGDNTVSFMENGPYRTDKLTVNAVKLYGDGALGSRGALMKAAYSDAPSHTGIQIIDLETYDTYSQACLEYGFQLCTHCIGDSANASVLELYANSLGEINDKRWRIEHAQVVTETDRHFFREYGIIPSVQPVHATSDGDWAEDRIGAHRMTGAYAYNSLKQELGIIALGTDFPVERISPLENYCAAVFRKNRYGEPAEGFEVQEALSREDALRGLTIWAALASFEETEKGSIEIGKRADFVLLDRDLLKSSEEDVFKTKVLNTILAGEVFEY